MKTLLKAIAMRNSATNGGVRRLSIGLLLLETFFVYVMITDPPFMQDYFLYNSATRFGLPVLMLVAWIWGIWSMPTTRSEFETRLARLGKDRRKR